jgi:hypothetical protein
LWFDGQAAFCAVADIPDGRPAVAIELNFSARLGDKKSQIRE